MFGIKHNEIQESQAQITPTEWLNEVLKEAIKEKASDIHILPLADRMAVEFRIDGVMQTIDEWDKENHEHVISRIKVLSNMDVVEKQTPQDGHMEILLNWPKKVSKQKSQSIEKANADIKKPSKPTEPKENRDQNKQDDATANEREESSTTQIMANFRVSLMPTVDGEVAVLRALNRAENLMNIENLGFSKKVFPTFKSMIQRSHGMVLLTGPTGSGKTTTLYSIIDEIRSKERAILTLEDPVEYSLSGIRQTQIQGESGTGVSWSEGKKATLRQDPDVLMVGEIRDAETAEIAIHAALAGRLVFSTFHTSSVEGVLTQLLDMQIARSSISSSLTGIITQRLVRKNCDKCLVEVPPSMELLKLLGVNEWNLGNVHSGEGCRACNGTGYRGRIGIFEVLVMDDELRAMILQKSSFEELTPIARRKILQTLTGDGLEKVQQGITTIEEIVRTVV
jgi:type IV pilus assembly protein PilB